MKGYWEFLKLLFWYGNPKSAPHAYLSSSGRFLSFVLHYPLVSPEQLCHSILVQWEFSCETLKLINIVQNRMLLCFQLTESLKDFHHSDRQICIGRYHKLNKLWMRLNWRDFWIYLRGQRGIKQEVWTKKETWRREEHAFRPLSNQFYQAPYIFATFRQKILLDSCWNQNTGHISK